MTYKLDTDVSAMLRMEIAYVLQHYIRWYIETK